MRYWGVHYDTGVHFSPDALSRISFDADLVRYELTAIRHDLRANAVRIVGEDLERLRLAANIAAELGLSVFLSPWQINASNQQLLPYLADAAALAEELRNRGVDVHFVVGCELSLFTPGIIPGAGVYDRVAWLVSLRSGGTPNPTLEQVSAGVNEMLRQQVATVRAIFQGPLTYAAGRWENVDWTLFEMVGLDYYKQEQTDAEYVQGLRDAARRGKPVAVLEVGCCTYEGADAKGGMGWTILNEWEEGGAQWVGGSPPIRSEATQARYLAELFEVYLREGVDAAFAFTFTAPYHAHDPENPQRDFDMACFGITKLYAADTPRGQAMPPWAPKEAYYALSAFFGRSEAARQQQRATG